MKHEAYLPLWQQMFSGAGIFPHPAQGLVSLDFQCVWEMYVVEWLRREGLGPAALYQGGANWCDLGQGGTLH